MSKLSKEDKSKLDALISKEIQINAAGLKDGAYVLRKEAKELLAEAEEMVARAERQIECDKSGLHKFVAVKGTGVFGDYFQEKCKHCGWIHES